MERPNSLRFAKHPSWNWGFRTRPIGQFAPVWLVSVFAVLPNSFRILFGSGITGMPGVFSSEPLLR